MDGQSGGDDSQGGASWRGGRTYDATNQIKQLLGVPTEDLGKPVVDAEPRTPPQNIPRNRQVGLAVWGLGRKSLVIARPLRKVWLHFSLLFSF